MPLHAVNEDVEIPFEEKDFCGVMFADLKIQYTCMQGKAARHLTAIVINKLLDLIGF